ncbi:MAG TPA: sugar ABC transporter ATP-binding protein [Rectinema sp.]|nr:sugar ABC transporter ATP-binding protein [Rectinema sp.]
MNNNVVLQMRHIAMEFDGVQVLDDVNLTLRSGEVQALVGENGAGKSTLMKILIGMYQPTFGEIECKGNVVRFRNIKDSQAHGISMIFQEFNQVKHLTVMENIYLGREPLTKAGLIDYKAMFKQSKQLLESMGVEISPNMYVRELTVAKQQLVEIAKALSNKAEIIIMDEPTSALSNKEIEHLMNMIGMLKAAGKSIIFISHKLEEIYRICDYVTVLRDGKHIYSGLLKGLDEKDLIKMMVDREITEMYPKEKVNAKDIVLEVKGLTRKNEFRNISLEVREGEILGLAGLMGAGRTEVIETIMGIRKADSGEILLRGKRIRNRLAADAIKNGILMAPEDRKKNGLILKLTVKDNLLMSALGKCVQAGYIRHNLEKQYAEYYIKELNIRGTLNQICSTLSGGNQQKVVLGRVLNADPDLIILDEPTRGIDVKTKSEIHKLMSELAKRGKAILMVSSEMGEILGMSDRIVVLHEGEQMITLKREEADANIIMQYAMGKKEAVVA